MFDFPNGQSVYRDRRGSSMDPYSQKERPTGEWDEELTITIENAFVASTSSAALRSATRSEILTAKSLYLTDPTADVRPGDRIRTADMPFTGSDPYFVHERPAADTNPFTGWQPVQEIPLEEVSG